MASVAACPLILPLAAAADNALNGTPSCANSAYQNTLLRDTWGWGASSAGEKMSESMLSPYIVRSDLIRFKSDFNSIFNSI